MPGFAWRLSDIQVMQVANFVSSNWGNRGPQVTLDDVTRLRPESQ
jgi:mono/diheme cytochrome c family protein